jgi:hypothetical protein
MLFLVSRLSRRCFNPAKCASDRSRRAAGRACINSPPCRDGILSPSRPGSSRQADWHPRLPRHSPDGCRQSIGAIMPGFPILTFGQAMTTMSSREIADLCGKQHKNVMADCRKLILGYEKIYENQLAEISALVKSGAYSDRKDSQGRSYPTFTTRITGKGQVVLEKKFRARQASAA